MTSDAAFVPRRVEKRVLSLLRDEPVVLVEGPRTVGKSTLLRAITSDLSGTILDLDDVSTLEAVRRDPATMIASAATHRTASVCTGGVH